MTDTTVALGARPLLPRRTLFETIVERIARRMLPAALEGRLEVTVPSGRVFCIGDENAEPPAVLTIRSWRVIARAVARGGNGFAESYISGEVESPDLVALIGFFARNKHALVKAGGRLFTSRRLDRLQHLRRRNSRAGSKRNIADHYDLGNAFYRLWLDPTMTYSSAFFKDEAASLESAQCAKYRAVLDAMELPPEARVLEIGCGWGGFARTLLAQTDARIEGITLSREQLEFAAAQTDGTRASFRFEDYRNTSGQYDGIASIEMIEAVGEENWPTYFRNLHDRLKPGAGAVIQAITIAPDHFETYRRKADFIQRYIFPGGMLPSVPALQQQAASADLNFETVEEFPLDYARTLAEWKAAFEANWESIRPLGFDERFRRTWLYYLAYCEAGFREGVISVGIYRFVKHAK
ncbi:MAG: cyclopropane-fatty-acyl-phospholipid synthase family protein [Pseudomonadota bacterium]